MTAASVQNERISRLESTLANVFMPLKVVELGITSRFATSFEASDLGYCRIMRAHIAARHFHSKLAEEAATPPERYVLRYMSKGCIWFGGRNLDVTCGAGSFMVLSQARSFEVRHSGMSSSISLALPGGLLKAQIRDIDQLCFTPVACSDGTADVLRQLMSQVWTNRASLSYEDSKSVAGAATQLMRAVFRPLGEASQCRERPISSRALEMGQVIEFYLDRDDLNADFIAARMGISKRYLSEIAARQGTTLGKLILLKRLERCREDLQDPTQNSRSVTDIAFSWGFKDSSHFSHRFSEHFGLSPSAFRRKYGVRVS